MAYQVQLGHAVTVRHPVRDIAGALVTGQAASLTTTLSDPDAAASALTVTKAEIGSSGWVLVTFTPTAAGVWQLEVTNPAPATADGQTYEYSIDVQALGAVGGAGLTTLTRVKQQLGLESESAFDTLLGNLISEVSAELEGRAGRTFAEAQHVRYLDGEAVPWLWLPEGPLVSIDLVESIVYGDDGAGGLEITATTLDASTYLGRGWRTEGQDGPPCLIKRGGLWTPGDRNYRVTWTGGYATLPDRLVGNATRAVVAMFQTRQVDGVHSKTEGEYSIDPLSPMQQHQLFERLISGYRYGWSVH